MDFDSPEERRIEEILQRLRDTLSDEMAIKSFRMRHHREPVSSELLQFKNQLVNDHYDEGFDAWVENHLYIDVPSGSVVPPVAPVNVDLQELTGVC